MRSITVAGTFALAALAVACGDDPSGAPNVSMGGSGGSMAMGAGGDSVTGTGGDSVTGAGGAPDDGDGGMGGDSTSASGGSAGAGDNQAPSADDQSVDVPEDGELTIEIEADDPEGDELTFSYEQPEHGSIATDGASVTYEPDADYHGPDAIVVTVSDGENEVESEVSITVTPVNDDPVASADGIAGNEDAVATVTAAALLSNDADVDGDTLTLTAVGSASVGDVDLDGTNVTFTPPGNFSGTATFEYTVSDGTATDTGVVTVTVGGVNDPPVAVDDEVSGEEDEELEIATTALTDNDSDPEGQTLSVSAVSNPVDCAVSLDGGTITVTFDPDFEGEASFDYTVSDGADDDVGKVEITVEAVNDKPVALDDSEETLESTPVTITLSGTDVDGDSLTFAVVDGPEHGSLGTITQASPTSATVLYTPDQGYSGEDSFTFTASDGTDTSTAGTLSITVDNVAECSDGVIEAPETCDDLGLDPDDGCDEDCQVEDGWDCTGEPSDCETICGDGMLLGSEECDDGPSPDTDGCTSECKVGTICAATEVPLADGDRFVTDPETGTCYVSFDDDQTTFGAAQAACVAIDGHLATITSAVEQDLVTSVQNPTQNPWIGASDTDVEDSFAWVTGEPFGFVNFGQGQPDDGNGVEDCVHLISGQPGFWNDTICDLTTFVVGRICEIPSIPCGDGFIQPGLGEECDDGNGVGSDGCSSSCTVEAGAVCGGEPTLCTKLVINEFDYDQPGTPDTAEFIEIFNAGTATADLTNFVVVLMNGADNMEYGRVQLSGTLAPGSYAVLCPPGGPGACSFAVAPGATIINFASAQNNLQNGPDAIGLFAISGPSATPLDVVSYGAAITGQITGITGLTSFVEGSPILSNADLMSPNSLQRKPNAADSGDNVVDFSSEAPTPGAQFL